MPTYLLPFSITTAVCVALSAALLIWQFHRRPNDKLPAAYSPITENEDQLEGVKDPFDIIEPEDTIDGQPLDEDEFWVKVRIAKLVLSIIFALLVVDHAIGLGWAVASGDGYVAPSTLHLITFGYLLTLCASNLSANTISTSWPMVIHIAALTALSSLLQATSLLLPSERPSISAPEDESNGTTFWFISWVLTTVAMVLSWTIPRGPSRYFPPERVFTRKTLANASSSARNNVSASVSTSVWGVIFFQYTTAVVMLGYTSESLEIRDLPILPASFRATTIFTDFRQRVKKGTMVLPSFMPWRVKPNSPVDLGLKLLEANKWPITALVCLAATSATLFYVPAFFLQRFIKHLEQDPDRQDIAWAWVYCAGLFASNVIMYLITGQLWSISTTDVNVRFRTQLNTLLFSKTLVRKNVASTPSSDNGSEGTKTTSPPSGATTPAPISTPAEEVPAIGIQIAPSATAAVSTTPATASHPESGKGSDKKDEGEFSSKAQIMTLMTTDVDRVADFAWHLFTLVDSPIELTIGSIFLYHLLGVSAFIGLAVAMIFFPINHFASKWVISAQDSLMKSRDERVGLMNEILGAMRMLKFMAWERSFEIRVLKIRDRELFYQWRNYVIETLFNATWQLSPILITVTAFWHYAVVLGKPLTPATAFTSLSVFTEMRFALGALPETFINVLQSIVSMKRISKYLNAAEVSEVAPLHEQEGIIAFNSATISWPRDRTPGSSMSSVASTPRQKFQVNDLNLNFPQGELSFICGKLGSGKTLMLLAMLGEADILAGQVISPRSPPDALARLMSPLEDGEGWVVPNMCAYVPQTAWLQNATIKENILFNLPFDEQRYQETLEVCALLADLDILEDGDESEIGERGVNLSGGQKARVSLARAVYSRASTILLDDVLSAVDAHTAHHLFEKCIKGNLMRGRTVILVSHHVQLCAPDAKYVVALEKGRLVYSGPSAPFMYSRVMKSLIQSQKEDTKVGEQEIAEELLEGIAEKGASSQTTIAVTQAKEKKVKPPRKLVEDEARAVGRIGRNVWKTYLHALGGKGYWTVFGLTLIIASLPPVVENGWIRHWSGAVVRGDETRTPLSYISIYALITFLGLIVFTLRWFFLYRGSIHASVVLYKNLLQSVLFAPIRFHDTINRGRLLNRFGKDFEGIDSSLIDSLGRSVFYLCSVTVIIITVTWIGGLPFFIVVLVLAVLYFEVARVYGQTARDMRRLDSVARSPLYSIYGETVVGVPVLRAFGASSKFMRDMLRCVDTNNSPYYWLWGVNRWISVRFNMLSSAIISLTAVVMLLNHRVDAAAAGFALAFITNLTSDLLFLVRRFVALEQAMVAVERVKEFSELQQEPPEFVDPRPPASWPSSGAIEVKGLVVRYAPELPAVLHNLDFSIKPGEKIGILGRTGCGKSTLALSFFRFVEAAEGRILIDGMDIADIGLTDLRSRITIIPQDPTILSGTLRSTLDIFDEYEDAEIYEALRRVHLIPSDDEPRDPTAEESDNVNVFRTLESPVSEGGENFSAGEKQLICMARAILKRTKLLIMDEATASVDYATDELIGRTIRHEFAGSTILTIAHRLRTVIDYDRIMVLDAGRIVEFDQPGVLLADPQSQFYALCKATGRDEFSALLRLSNASSYYSTSSGIRGSRPHTPGPNILKPRDTTPSASYVSWKDAEAELERDRSTSTPEVIEGITDAEPLPRYEATPSPTPVRRASEKILDGSDDLSPSEDGGDDRRVPILPEMVIEGPKDKYDESGDDQRTNVQEGSTTHYDHRHDEEAGYVLASRDSDYAS